MAGVIDADAHMTEKLQPFGYVTLTAGRDNLLCRAGGTIRAHEFHYAQSDRQRERVPRGKAERPRVGLRPRN